MTGRNGSARLFCWPTVYIIWPTPRQDFIHQVRLGHKLAEHGLRLPPHPGFTALYRATRISLYSTSSSPYPLPHSGVSGFRGCAGPPGGYKVAQPTEARMDHGAESRNMSPEPRRIGSFRDLVLPSPNPVLPSQPLLDTRRVLPRNPETPNSLSPTTSPGRVRRPGPDPFSSFRPFAFSRWALPYIFFPIISFALSSPPLAT